jgi:hypothetical protein
MLVIVMVTSNNYLRVTIIGNTLLHILCSSPPRDDIALSISTLSTAGAGKPVFSAFSKAFQM